MAKIINQEPQKTKTSQLSFKEIQSMEIPGWLRRLYMRSTAPSMVVSGHRGYVRVFYAGWSKLYDFTVGLDTAYRRNARRVVEATVQKGNRVLDVGVGTGILAEYGAHLAREYVGVDYSGAMLEKAARKLAERRVENVRLCWGDASRLNFDDGVFDAVVSSFAIVHIDPDERPRALKEMARVLAPGGRLGLNQAAGELIPGFSTRAQLHHWLPDAGLFDVKVEDHDDVYRIVTAKKASE